MVDGVGALFLEGAPISTHPHALPAGSRRLKFELAQANHVHCPCLPQSQKGQTRIAASATDSISVRDNNLLPSMMLHNSRCSSCPPHLTHIHPGGGNYNLS